MARLINLKFTGQFDNINMVPAASGLFPTLRNKSKKRKEKSMSFRMVVKNGDVNYEFNSKTGSYDTEPIDVVTEYATLSEALAEFLYAVEDYGQASEKKVVLTYLPSKKKGKKEKK